jgi:hypothetical protein
LGFVDMSISSLVFTEMLGVPSSSQRTLSKPLQTPVVIETLQQSFNYKIPLSGYPSQAFLPIFFQFNKIYE